MSGALLVGVDVGTTRIKVGAVDTDGNELAQTSQRTPWRTCATGAEAVPDELAESVERALTELLAGVTQPVAGIGITSMAETGVLVGSGGEPLGPAIAWYDQRAAAEVADLEAALTREQVGRTTGLDAKPVPTVLALRFLMRTRPELRRAVTVLSVAEWIAFRLTGTAAAEPSLASRTGALAVPTGRWWPEVIEWAGLPGSLFPELRAAGSEWGRVAGGPASPARLRGAAVTVAGHDHLVAAIGAGITGATQVMDSCGTAEAVMLAVPADAARDPAAGLEDGIATGWHALPGFHCLIAGLPLGIELTPLLEELGASHGGGRTSLDAAALDILDGAPVGGAGERWLEAVRRAVERAHAARRGLERLSSEPVSEVRVSGGWAANPVLRRLKDASFDGATLYPLVAEAGVRGAGLMAGLAAGVYDSVAEFPAPATARGSGHATTTTATPAAALPEETRH